MQRIHLFNMICFPRHLQLCLEAKVSKNIDIENDNECEGKDIRMITIEILTKDGISSFFLKVQIGIS